METKRLYKSTHNRMVSGVCAGIADYFNIDPTWIRLALVALTIGGFGSGAVAYIVGAIIIPNEP